MSASEPVAPHNLEAERAVIGAVLIDNAVYLTAAAIVVPDTYFRAGHGLVWRTIGDLIARDEPVDLVTLVFELERAGDLDDAGGAAYVSALIDGVPHATNIASYARKVQECAARRALIATADALKARAYAGEDDAATMTEAAAADLDATRQRLAIGTSPARRAVRLVPASAIAVRPVRWLWADRLALGTLGLMGGREGVGKTICSYTLAADVTRGTLLGACAGIPRAVIVAATEDSWAHTIVPRLMAAGADLARVYRVDVETAEGVETGLLLPRDLQDLAERIREVGAVLIILDPLLSRLDSTLDTHKDAEVRVALEPLVAIANETDTCILGLIHVNKSASSDPLTMLMGSRAFAAVARSVLFVMADPEDETRRLLGQAKNNLGRTDLPTLAFRIGGAKVAETAEGEVWTGKLEWLGEAGQSIREAVEAATERTGDRTATAEAGEWLTDYLTSEGGSADSADVKRTGAKAGHSADALKRARARLRIAVVSTGFPRKTIWMLPAQSEHARGGPSPTAPTAPTGDLLNKLTNYTVGAVGAVSAVEIDPTRGAPTDGPSPRTLEAQPSHPTSEAPHARRV